ncbi:hypothetical protein JCM11641_007951 [Rhodosporidiobolus odoratus]
MSFALPLASASDMARRESHNAFASTSSAPSTSEGQFHATSTSGTAEAAKKSAPNKARRRGKGKGRMMMIKIFYSLNSPRFGSPAPNGSSTAPSAHSPDFLAVLDPALAPSPVAAPTPSSLPGQLGHELKYSCMARLSAPVWVQVLNGKKTDGFEERQQFGRVTLKTCLSAICISRPELVFDASKDFSVSAVDPYESSHQRQPPAGSNTLRSSFSGTTEGGRGLVEGKGMLSWTLAEKKEGTTMVCGKISGADSEMARNSKRRKGENGGVLGDFVEDEEESGDESEETLEVWLQLTERDAFTQGQFLDCLRSYHNPVQHLQSEMSDFNSSPPKRQESAAFAPRSSGDPVKRKRPREQPSLPIPPAAVAAPPAPFATSPASATLPSDLSLQDPRLLALIGQLVPSLAPTAPAPPTAPLDSAQAQALLPALQTLAQLYGLDVTGAPSAPAPVPPSSIAPSSAAPGPSSHFAPSERPPTGTPAANGKGLRKKERETFATIDPNTLPNVPLGKQNPRAPNEGCSNCKRKKSTVWREGTGDDGITTSVCNACGMFYNKNGYHRSKAGQDAQAPANLAAAPDPSSAVSASTSSVGSAPKGGRSLQGRLTATCEADLKKQKTKRKVSSGSADRHFAAGIIPPLSPSKRIGPGSPSLHFNSSFSRSGGRAYGGTMSSPGRSPRMKYRQAANLFPATSPVRGLGVDYDLGGEGKSGSFDFGNLFGGPGSPSPARIDHSRQSSGGKNLPSYLLTASPGTALDRILNDTNIGVFSGMLGGQAAGDNMQLEETGGQQAAAEGGFADFGLFLQPGSPTLNKENTRPKRQSGQSNPATEAPTPDLDSFESVLSSLRRDFTTRLSSNALTAPSSPAPSSPCILPRTSAASPGSKGKAPATSGRAPPSILDSFIDGLVPAFALDVPADSDKLNVGKTPDSDAWSPANGQNEDQTVTLDSADMNASRVDGDLDYSHLAPSHKASRRAAFIPSHLIAPSDDFDFGSLPPSSPPQLPSEAFPTPSDYGITPSADGGDGDERATSNHGDCESGASPLTIEAVAEKVATEPNEDARKAMMALLQSLGASPAGSDASVKKDGAVQLAGPDGDKIQLDRSTVNRLLSLISANPASTATATPTIPAPSGMTASTSSATLVPNKEEDQPDLSALDLLKSFEPISGDHGQQVNDLFGDLFGSNVRL